MKLPPVQTIATPDLIRAILQDSTEPDPKVLVFILDESQEHLLDARYLPIADVAVLLGLHGIRPESI